MSGRNSKVFQERLRDTRLFLGMTQTQLARKMDADPSVISFYENGSRSPGLENLVSIADALNVSLDYLTGRISQRTLFP